MKRLIDDNIWYIEGNSETINQPLSSDTGIINDNGKIWLYDVGNNEKNLIHLNDLIIRNYNVVISHFHLDHVGVLDDIIYNDLYVSNESYKHLNKGTIVSNDIYIDNIHLFLIPSIHAKGCLGLEFNEYAFIGDSLCPKYKDNELVYSVSILASTIKTLKNIKAKYLIESHHMGYMRLKENVIKELTDIYKKREKGNQYIKVNNMEEK